MKNFGLIASLLILAACNSGGGSGGSAAPTKTDSPVVVDKPVDTKPEEMPEIVNNTDAEIVPDYLLKQLNVFQAKEKLTLTFSRMPTANMGFCGEMKYHLQLLKMLAASIKDSEAKIEALKAKLAELNKSPNENRYEIIRVETEIDSAEQDKATFVKNSKTAQKQMDETFTMVGGEGKLVWSGKWKANFEKIREENKGWNVVMYLPVKTEFKAIGYEMLPADKMMMDLGSSGFLREDGVLKLEYYFETRMNPTLSLYGACPLKSTADLGFPKPENGKIELEVTFTK